MPLTKEQLLVPRIKCIVRFPTSPFPIGAILEQDFEEPETYNYTDSNNRIWKIDNPELYPDIFKEIHWWSDRKINEMPEYMKETDGEVYKVTWFDDFTFDCNDDYGRWVVNEHIMSFYEPATEEEYVNQKQQ